MYVHDSIMKFLTFSQRRRGVVGRSEQHITLFYMQAKERERVNISIPADIHVKLQFLLIAICYNAHTYTR